MQRRTFLATAAAAAVAAPITIGRFGNHIRFSVSVFNNDQQSWQACRSASPGTDNVPLPNLPKSTLPVGVNFFGTVPKEHS